MVDFRNNIPASALLSVWTDLPDCCTSGLWSLLRVVLQLIRRNATRGCGLACGDHPFQLDVRCRAFARLNWVSGILTPGPRRWSWQVS